MNDSINIAALATMSPKEAMKMLEQIRSNIMRSQEDELKELIRKVAMDANVAIEELKKQYAEKNIEFIINGTITIEIQDGKIGVSYAENKPLATKVSRYAIYHYRDRQDELIGKEMYFNLKGITFNVSLSQNNAWVVIHDDKVISADAPSTLIKRVALEVLGIKSNQSGWLVIKLKGGDNDDNTEESVSEDIDNELESDISYRDDNEAF